MKRIFEYSSVQALIKDWMLVVAKKYPDVRFPGERGRKYSLRGLTRQIGCNSPAALKMFLDGSSTMSIERVRHLFKLLELNRQERKDAEVLYYLTVSGMSPSMRRAVTRRLL